MPLSSPNQPTAAMSVAAGMLVGTVFQQPLSHKLVLLARGSRWNSRSSQFSHSYLSSWHPSCNPNCCYFFAQKKRQQSNLLWYNEKHSNMWFHPLLNHCFWCFISKGDEIHTDSSWFIYSYHIHYYPLIFTHIISYPWISMNIKWF
jgi:hypothetical protein